MQARLKSWRHTIWQRKGWFLFLLVYKIIEDWGLGKLIGYIEAQEGIWVNISDFIISYLPWLTWIAIPITILILIGKSWLDSAKFQPVLANVQGLEYSPQVTELLNKLIKRGEELTKGMQRADFHFGQLGQDVREWLDSMEHDVWEVIPEYANLLTANQGRGQEPFTEQEKLRYSGWDFSRAALRVSVDRQLLHLREIRSRIQGVDRGGSQSE